MTLVLDGLFGRTIQVTPAARSDRVGQCGYVRGVCYAETEAGINLLVEFPDGQLEMCQYRQVRLTGKDGAA